MKKKGILILVVVAALFLASCTPGTTPTKPPEQTQTIVQRVTALESRVAQLDSRIAGMSVSDVAPLEDEIRALEAEVAILKNETAALKVAKGEEEAATEETTRWSTDVWADYTGYKLVDVDLEVKRIEDEGDYNPYLLFYNKNINEYFTTNPEPRAKATEGMLWLESGVMKRCTVESTGSVDNWSGAVWAEASMSDIYKPITIDAIEISFHPQTGDRVKVDAGKVYLDNYRAPFLDWGVVVSERSDGTCRSIKATSDVEFTLPVPKGFQNVPECPMPYEMRLVFELYYK